MPAWNEDGWFRCWRKIWTSHRFRSLPSGDSRLVLIALISQAQHEPVDMSCHRCGAAFRLEVGDCWASQDVLAEMACTTRQVVRTVIRRFSVGRNPIISGNKICEHVTKLTLVNYAEHNEKKSELTRTQPGPNQDLTRTQPELRRNKKEEERKRKELGTRPTAAAQGQTSLPGVSKAGAPTPEQWAAADRLRHLIVNKHPEHPIALPAEWRAHRYRWANALRIASERGRSLATLLSRAEWALERGYTIDGPQRLLRSEGAIVEHQANEAKRVSPPPARNPIVAANEAAEDAYRDARRAKEAIARSVIADALKRGQR